MDNDQLSAQQKEIIVYLILLAVVLFGTILFYQYYRGPINYVFMTVNNAFLYPVTYISDKAAGVYYKAQHVNPWSLTLQNIKAQYGFVGQYLKWPLAALLMFLGVYTIRGLSVKEKYRNKYSIQRLLENNIDVFPCIAPVVNRKKSIIDEPLDEGPWRVARQPIQFVAENGLLRYAKNNAVVPKEKILNKNFTVKLNSDVLQINENAEKTYLDKGRAKELFVDQLGEQFDGIKNLDDYQKGLASVFLAFGHGDRDTAQRMLDQMSSSFEEGETTEDCFVDTTGADEIINQYIDSEKFEDAVKNHQSFVTTYLHALKVFADSKGVLPPAQFIWLRPMDRTLWYTLNQIGGRTSWVEASGPWAHYLAEESLQEALTQPEIHEAVDGLIESLMSQGWLQWDDAWIQDRSKKGD